MLIANLALLDNIGRGNINVGKFDGVFEDRYNDIVKRYDNSGQQGKRPIDYFAQAYSALIQEVNETERDCLGDIYMMEITYGEHGQFFTPEPITDMMANIIHAPSKSEEGRQVICDPCCGSGRMLLSAHKTDPYAFLVGIDLDARCAKMCALNLHFRNMSGDVYHGNTLSAEMQTVWMVRNGFIQEQDVPPAPTLDV